MESANALLAQRTVASRRRALAASTARSVRRVPSAQTPKAQGPSQNNSRRNAAPGLKPAIRKAVPRRGTGRRAKPAKGAAPAAADDSAAPVSGSAAAKNGSRDDNALSDADATPSVQGESDSDSRSDGGAGAGSAAAVDVAAIRAANIARNNARLQALGLGVSVTHPEPTRRKRVRQASSAPQPAPQASPASRTSGAARPGPGGYLASTLGDTVMPMKRRRRRTRQAPPGDVRRSTRKRRTVSVAPASRRSARLSAHPSDMVNYVDESSSDGDGESSDGSSSYASESSFSSNNSASDAGSDFADDMQRSIAASTAVRRCSSGRKKVTPRRKPRSRVPQQPSLSSSTISVGVRRTSMILAKAPKSTNPSRKRAGKLSSKELSCATTQLVASWLGRTVAPAAGTLAMKDAAMQLCCSLSDENSGASVSFSRMSGIQQFRDAVVLFVNIGGSSYRNVWLKDDRGRMGARITWFSQRTQSLDSPVIARMLKHGARRAPGSHRLGSLPILLFCRLEGEPYACCGRLARFSEDLDARPMRFVWELMDYDDLVRESPEWFDRVVNA